MMAIKDEVQLARAQLDEEAGQRFRAREANRAQKQAEIERLGVLGAAGISAAVNRSLQLTVAEGRTAAATSAAPVAPSSAPVIRGRGSAATQARALEAIVAFNDLDQINFLEHGLRASRSVCRLTYGGQPIGTGFLVAPNLLLTNNHVIGSPEQAADFLAEFDYELDADENPRTPKRFAVDPNLCFVTSPLKVLDFTLVGICSEGTRGERLGDLGWLPLSVSGDKILEGEPVVIIQHPEGREKQICLFNSEMVDRSDQYIYYTTDTNPGASGSPGFNRQWQVVALHHASAPSGVIKRGKQTAANEGIRISSILDSLQKQDERVTGTTPGIYSRLTDPVVQGVGRPTAPVVFVASGRAEASQQPEATRIRTHPPAFYANPERGGYEPVFLDESFVIPLPVLPPVLRKDIARLTDGSTELKYTHYSVVMSASRRLAYFSAANIDGSEVVSIPRTDRDPDNPLTSTQNASVELLEAADIWFFDGRLPEDSQVGGDVYDGTAFDYGHLTRRLDPVWGDPRTLRLANDDTFTLTNCAPQHHKLNTGNWERMENAVYSAAKNRRAKFTVITGPVLDPRDPVIRGVQCPTSYWKIIAFVGDEGPMAMGFLQWQTDLVGEIQKDLEALGELERAEQWHVPILDIARLTSLDFGPLIDKDVKSKGGAERLTESLVAQLIRP